MKRFLFVVPPFAGHVLPTVSVGRALRARGHQVAWVGLPQVRAYLPEDAELIALETADDEQLEVVPASDARLASRGWESLQVLWEEALLPLARGMLPGVRAVIEHYRPDALVVDQQAVAGALAARRAQLPWATFCTTSASVVDSLIELPKVKQWVVDHLRRLELESELPHAESPDTSPQLTVVFSTLELCGEDRAWPAHYRFVGPSIHDRPDATEFPWQWLSRRPRLFVSLGTISADSPANARFFSAVAEGLRDFDGQVVMVAPPELVPAPPPNMLVRARVPQLALLREVDAVLTHAGHNTVCEALAHGLPMVVAPIRHDQPIVAAQVLRAGAGVRLRYGRVTAAAVRGAVTELLSNPSYRQAAERLRAGFAEAGGAEAAADALETLV